MSQRLRSIVLVGLVLAVAFASAVQAQEGEEDTGTTGYKDADTKQDKKEKKERAAPPAPKLIDADEPVDRDDEGRDDGHGDDGAGHSGAASDVEGEGNGAQAQGPAGGAPQPAGAQAAEAVREGMEPVEAGALPPAVLRLYVITSRNTYARFGYDIYEAASGRLIESGVSPDVAAGEDVGELRLAPGTYKIVRRGEPFDTRVDFATVELHAETLTDYVIVVDPDSYAFRGAGVVVGELPTGTRVGGFRVALTGGTGFNMGHRYRVVGTTSGVTAQLALFGNFSLLYDRGPHHLQVSADANLTMTDPAFGKPYSSFDQLTADALYSFQVGNPFIGPYARAGLSTRVYPGYLYLDGDTGVVDVNINRLDGTTVNRTFGTEANLDDLRIKLSKPFGTFILQEELGATLKAFDLDLFILDVHVASRLGYGFRQGLTQELLVVNGDDEGSPVTLDEVDDYFTHGPVIGATGRVTFARWLYGAARFGMMAPLQDRDRAGSDFFDRLLIDLSGTAGLKLPAFTSFLYASFDYTFRLTRDGYLTHDTQFDEVLMGRLNLTIF